MMRSTFQAMLLASAAIAVKIEAETEIEVESQATYGMTLTQLHTPQPAAIAFPNDLTVGGGSVLPPV